MRRSSRSTEGLRVNQDHGTVFFSLDGPPPALRRREILATRKRDALTVVLRCIAVMCYSEGG